MKSRFRIVGVLLTMIAVPAWGAALYKCLNVDGIPSYVSKRVAGATCTVVVNHVHRVPSPAVAVPAVVPVSGAVKDAVVSAPSVGGAAVMSAPVRPSVAGGGSVWSVGRFILIFRMGCVTTVAPFRGKRPVCMGCARFLIVSSKLVMPVRRILGSILVRCL